MSLSQSEIDELAERLEHANPVFRRRVLAAVKKEQRLSELIATPVPDDFPFDLVLLDGGVYIKALDPDGVSDMDYDQALVVGAGLLRVVLAARAEAATSEDA